MTAKTEVTTKQNLSINIVFSWSQLFFLVFFFYKTRSCRADYIRQILFFCLIGFKIDKEMLELDEDPISEIPSAN
jgi:hypothetical protein